MTYTAGSLIEAVDYNGFVNTNTNANVNDVRATGTTDRGYGQAALSTVSAGGVVTASQWATFVNAIASLGAHTNTTITSRAAPVTGDTISILNNLNTDLTNITTNRGNAAAVGATISTFSGSVSKTTATGSGQAAWTITFTQTVTFSSADTARYFFNAGGRVRLLYGKTSTGTDHDPDFNVLAGQTGSIDFTGRVAGTTNTIAGQAYTGTTRLSGSGGTQTTLATTTGFYNLTAGAAAVTIFQLNNTTAPYTPEFIRTQVALSVAGTVLTFTTVWSDDGTGVVGATSNISGGTATDSGATSITGTAPTTLLTLFAPSTTHLTASWGTPTINSTVA